ncbi:candidate aryl-alcohol dehydrogenase [Postia placenta Mad-698-R]|uniref:NADP-dependent oxidoreductase domain-containing protein n=1 Tax=Postia placenta MAD-698-R-SB12 TaxID=670580 RepID=A0A1X6MKG8_9APHY|nr:hypothetical protein POSPLADRAFT_1158808 [Postia placenta MAD-698-R-SB12]EED80280.1 candidate aryl-alcohol dehydrogenase [Postia placenta Mad-698-R]OSX56779.1 hypothetical protein POSPLADRAFT_1158808 [Postia placenta MAD-698-R-SB12]
MSIGDQWGQYGMGEMNKDRSFRLLDAFYAAGGNFVDTANAYQDETSERFLGEWMATRGVRDQMVVATKGGQYSTNYKCATDLPQKSTYVGNNMKSLYLSVEASLAKLQTDYIDILYLHWWDWECSIEEVMNGLHHLIAQRKVLYLVRIFLAVGNGAAAAAHTVQGSLRHARVGGLKSQHGAWSILQRDFEREIIPMAREEGMALAPCNVLAAGRIRTDEEEERRRRRTASNEWERTPDQRRVCQALEKVAQEVGAPSITSVAIAYVMQKTPYVFPIVGGRKVEHLMDNIAALDIALSRAQIAHLEDVLPFDVGFPTSMIGDGSEFIAMYKASGHFDKWPTQQAIRPEEYVRDQEGVAEFDIAAKTCAICELFVRVRIDAQRHK